MKRILKISILLLIYSCTSNLEKELDPDIEFQKCIGPDIYNLLMDFENLLDNQIMEFYDITEEDLIDGYRNYIASWRVKDGARQFLDTTKKIEIKREILDNAKIREILDWSLNMGDSIYVLIPGESEKLVNELQINYSGKLIKCLTESVDPVAISYLEIKSMIDLKYMGIVTPLLNYLTKENLENDILKKLIVIELYIRPLVDR